MIKNERQYKVTRAQRARFEEALTHLVDRPGLHPIQQRLEVDTVRSQIAELQEQLDEYEGLKQGSRPVGKPNGLDDLPRLLIRQRIASGMTQLQLADRLGMKEQQIQRYEADDWATANLGRLSEVASAVGLSIAADEMLRPDPVNSQQLNATLANQGLDRDFVAKRLQPESVDMPGILDLTARLNRIYGWRPSDVLRGNIDEPKPLLAAASFKLPLRHNEVRTRAYTVYSHYLAMLTLDATPRLERQAIPTDPAEFRELVLERSGSIDFPSILDAAWSLGIAVMPLADTGAFHAVLWRANHRNIVVLKQRNRSPSRWAFDLLHEIRHAAEEPDDDSYAVFEDDATDVTASSEQVANRFAGDVLLDNRAEQIAEQAVTMAHGEVRRLKGAVPVVAGDNDVTSADLANYLAFRLSLQGIDWWGAASNLQAANPDPWEITRQRFLAACDLRRLASLDLDLLLQALTDAQ